MKRFLPDTIFARLFLMVLLAIVISHMMTFVLLLAFFGERQHRPLPGERRPQVVAPGDPAQAAPVSGSWFGPSGDYLGMSVDVVVQRR